MALARARRDARHRLLAGLRRRAVDAAPRHHLPALGVRGGAVLPVAGGDRQGHGAARRLNAQIAQLTELLSLEKTGKISARGAARAIAREPRGDRGRARPLQGPLRRRRRRRRDAQGQVSELAGAARRREADRPRARWRRSSCSTSRSRRCAASSRALEARARRLREEGQGIADADRRSRPAAQRRAGAARAGAVALPLRLLRPAARDPRQPARHPHRRRPLRVPVGGVLRRRPGGAQARGPRRARQARRARCSSSSRQIPPEITWVLRVDGHTDVRPIAARSSAPTGSCPRRAPSRWCST